MCDFRYFFVILSLCDFNRYRLSITNSLNVNSYSCIVTPMPFFTGHIKRKRQLPPRASTLLRPCRLCRRHKPASMTPWPVAVLFGGKVPFSLITRTTVRSTVCLGRFDYSAPFGKRTIVMSVSACPRACLRNLVNSLHVTAVARFSTGVVAVRYVLPVSWMTPCSHIVARNRRRDVDVCLKRVNRWQHGFDFAAYTQADPSGSDSIGPRTDYDICDCLVCVCYLRLWLDPPLAALRYAIYFRFCG